MLPHVEVTEEIMCCGVHRSTLLDNAALELFLLTQLCNFLAVAFLQNL
jgi:hypothetical protein